MIDGITGRGAVVPAGRAAVRPAGPRFQVDPGDAPAAGEAAGEVAGEVAETGAAARSAALGSARGMLALQEAAVEEAPDRRARRRGQDVLRALSGLQHDLLRGAVDPGGLSRLAALLAEEVPAAEDPDLRDAMQAVVLRARIELWRHGGDCVPQALEPSHRSNTGP